MGNFCDRLVASGHDAAVNPDRGVLHSGVEFRLATAQQCAQLPGKASVGRFRWRGRRDLLAKLNAASYLVEVSAGSRGEPSIQETVATQYGMRCTFDCPVTIGLAAGMRPTDLAGQMPLRQGDPSIGNRLSRLAFGQVRIAVRVG